MQTERISSYWLTAETQLSKRRLPQSTLQSNIEIEGIVGVDLCGDPSHPIDIDMLLQAFSHAKRAGMKLTLHFAETPHSASRTELEALLAMAPDRLGHVIHVPEGIKDIVAARSTGLELCMSYNVLAKLTTGGFEDHHSREWYFYFPGIVFRIREDAGRALCKYFW